MQASISLYPPRSSRIIFPPPPSSAELFASATRIHGKTLHIATRGSEKNHCPSNVVTLQSRFDGDGDANSTDGDKVVSASMTNSTQCVHLGVDTKNSPAFTLCELCTPSSVQSEVMSSDAEATVTHESG